ncbi:chondroitin sulfate synthase 1 precursor [Triplophysa rosa]|uniref:N-acetylgalactosaminyl-proteoglycan 3-beta-glucuronosyltransferase n=1 Tax=Triplophysa rosa TaxID=992332 RepID=A0A9W7X3V8_TRIRA|nr:chondroitin sulfate synthase 1 precursor [Triplophysa rosa]
MAGRSRRSWFSVLLGLVVGFTLASRLILPRASELKKAGQKRRASGGAGGCGGGAMMMMMMMKKEQHGGLLVPATEKPSVSRSGSFLFVGVMTAQKYLNNRAVAAYGTWAKSVPGKVEFFSSEGSDTSIPIPVVALQNVDDSYPPQKKSFMMLKYMHDHYLDQFEWFMRADDDVYIKSEKLESFLRSLNSSEAIFLGQTGMGARDELGKLALEPGENFCMGGPGVIMSREVLRRMVPHIRQCLQEMYTTHEDVEVGRCVRRFAGVQCVWSYERVASANGNHQHLLTLCTSHPTRCVSLSHSFSFVFMTLKPTRYFEPTNIVLTNGTSAGRDYLFVQEVVDEVSLEVLQKCRIWLVVYIANLST